MTPDINHVTMIPIVRVIPIQMPVFLVEETSATRVWVLAGGPVIFPEGGAVVALFPLEGTFNLALQPGQSIGDPLYESSHTMAILHFGQEKFISFIIQLSEEVSDDDREH